MLCPTQPLGSAALTTQSHEETGTTGSVVSGPSSCSWPKAQEALLHEGLHCDRPPALSRLCPVLLSILMRLDQAPN